MEVSRAASYLSHARYGKTAVRVFRIVRDGKWHHIVEYNVAVLVEGDLQKSYTEADNSLVVATDSLKNITYYLAKVSPHILNAEKFAIHLGIHLISKYQQLHKVFITVEQLRWTRIPVQVDRGIKGHPHSFLRDGDDKRVVKVEIDDMKGKDKLTVQVSAGITDLLVLKSTSSAFTGFVHDEYTTLVEVEDRILSTAIDLTYTFGPVSIPGPTDKGLLDLVIPTEVQDGTLWDERVPERARKATLEVFSNDESASVQVRNVYSWKPGNRDPGILGCCAKMFAKHEIRRTKKNFSIFTYEVTK